MKITKDMKVAVSYTLEVEGKIADQSAPGSPLEYVHGAGMLIPGFEAALEGKEVGDSFDFTVSPAEGYGEHNPKYVFDIPKSAFEIDGKLREDLLQPGRTIPMMNSAGQAVQGTVKAVGTDKVTMDFNHPMAGKTLHFSGKVEKVCEGHGEGHCCHSEGEGCRHGEGHQEGHCCHGEGLCHKDE